MSTELQHADAGVDDDEEHRKEEEKRREEAVKRALREWLSFNDLQELGIVPNWTTMLEWQKEYGFPTGRLFGPNSRRWNKHTEIDPWIASRPALRADFEGAPAKPKPRRGKAAEGTA